jgi:hypothetical protein
MLGKLTNTQGTFGDLEVLDGHWEECQANLHHVHIIFDHW